MIHHFPEELGADDYLVRSTAFEYDEKPIGSLLTRVIQSGYTRQPDGCYLKRSLPALDLAYTPTPLESPHYEGDPFKDVDPFSLGRAATAAAAGGVQEIAAATVTFGIAVAELPLAGSLLRRGSAGIEPERRP